MLPIVQFALRALNLVKQYAPGLAMIAIGLQTCGMANHLSVQLSNIAN